MDHVFKIAVCDDDRVALGIIAKATESIIEHYTLHFTVRCFSDLDSLREDMAFNEYDLLMLDIDLPGGDGIDFADKLRAENKRTEVIFVSNREDRVFDALRVRPYGFVRKRRFFEDMSVITKSIFVDNDKLDGPQKMVFGYGDKKVSVAVLKIEYIECEANAQNLYTEGGEVVRIISSMQKLEADLKRYGFLRTHKGYLVNYRYIRELASDGILLTDGKCLPVSRRKLKELKNEYMSLIQSAGAIVY